MNSVLVIIILLSLCENSWGKLEPPDTEISKEMIEYIQSTKLELSGVYDTLGIINTNQLYTRAILDYFFKYKNIEPVLIGNQNLNYYLKHGKLERTPNLFCYVNTKDDFKATMNYIKKNPFFDMNGYIQFIIGKHVVDKDWLMDTLEFIWSNDIINFVIVFQINKTIEVIGYNMFQNYIYNFTNKISNSTIYPNKLANMNGYTLYVGMLEDIPRNIMINGIMRGLDGNRIRHITSALNATLHIKIFKNYYEMKYAIMNENINFSFTKHFWMENTPYLIKASYPIRMDYITIAVPTGNLIPRYLYIFLVFKYKLWIMVVLSLIIVTGLNVAYIKFVSHEAANTQIIILGIYQIFLNLANNHIFKGRWSLKILLIGFVIYSLLVITTFNTGLRSSIIHPKYAKEILTISDLKNSDLKIAVNMDAMHGNLDQFNDIQDRLININDTNVLVKQFMQYNKDKAYVLPFTYLELLLQRKNSANRYIYRKIDEYLIGGHSVYNFPPNSPFMERIQTLVSLVNQFGLDLYGNHEHVINVLDDDNNVILTMKHLQGAFIIFIVGLLLSFISFVCELLQYKYANKRKINLNPKLFCVRKKNILVLRKMRLKKKVDYFKNIC